MPVREQRMVCPSCGFRQIYTWQGQKDQHPACPRCRRRMKSAGPITGRRSRDLPKSEHYRCPRCGAEGIIEWRGPKQPNPVCSVCRTRMKSVTGVYPTRRGSQAVPQRRRRKGNGKPEPGSLMDFFQRLFS